MRATARSHAAHTSTIRTALAAAVALLSMVAMTGVADAQNHGGGGHGGGGQGGGGGHTDPEPYDPTSDAGVMPDLYTSMQGGGDLKCLDLDASFTGTAHFEGVSEEEPMMEETVTPTTLLVASHEEDEEHDHEEPPAGLTFEIDGPMVSWSATFPIAAVIVKGGADTHAYLYDPNLLSDSGLITPPNESGNPNDVSSIRFCWTGDAENPDLVELCEAEAAGAGVGAIVSTAGPMLIRDGAVDQSTVPTGVELTYDPMTETVGFTAPFPVVTVVTAASDPVTHMIDPVAQAGSVPLSSNPGDGDVVLCGLAVPVPVEMSCEPLAGTTLVGPVPIVGGTVDPGLLPDVIEEIALEPDALRFTAAVPVLGVVVVASPPTLYSFPTPLVTGTVPVVIAAEDEAEIAFCATAVANDPAGDPAATDTADAAADALVQTMQDPTTIPTGGGPSGRTTLALVAFVLLALGGSTSLLVWSRGG